MIHKPGTLFILLILLPALLATPAGARDSKALTDTSGSPHAKLRCIDLDDVHWAEGFWAQRFALCRNATLPHLYERAADPNYGHALANLRIAAGLETGVFSGTHWHDAWIYKWLEAAAVVYAMTHDTELDHRMDDIIEIIGQAQQNDGYIASQITARGWPRFQDPHHHECYTMGHLIAAACVHHRMTGKDNLLAVACKTADYLYEQFKGKNPRMAHFPRNPSVVMAAVELYRTTGNAKYLKLANAVIDSRGAFKGGSDLNQDRIPLRREDSVVGHAVFYTYLYAGAADAYMETGDRRLREALERLWSDLVERKMYITGGCCALHRGLSIRNGNIWSADDVHEAAGAPYDLPNATAYNETCGQVGAFMWSWRMLLITGQAKYADLMERQMYNGFLGGLSVDGRRFFYTNPLRWYGRDHELLSNDSLLRHDIGKAKQICCPTNVLRTLAELHGYLYTTDETGLRVHHYAGSTLDDGQYKVRQETNYPWDGIVRITIEKAPPEKSINLRVPGWADGARVRINSQNIAQTIAPGTYVQLNRRWRAGDEIVLELPLKVRLMTAHPRVEADRGQVAVMRGPIVYCLESVDLPARIRLSDVTIPRAIRLSPRVEPTLLGGVTVLAGRAHATSHADWSNALYQPLSSESAQEVTIRLIPYYARANRGVSEMSVWLPLW